MPIGPITSSAGSQFQFRQHSPWARSPQPGRKVARPEDASTRTTPEAPSVETGRVDLYI